VSGSPDHPPSSPPQRTLTTTLGRISFTRQGSAERLVLLIHGLGRTRESFDVLRGALGGDFTFLAVDLLGHGGSDFDAPDLGAAAQAEALGEVLADLGIERAIVIGHSFGGSVALRLAALAPQRVERLALLAAGSYHYRLPFSWRACRNPFLWRLAGALGGREAALRALALPQDAVASTRERLGYRDAWSALGRAYRQATDVRELEELEFLVEQPFEVPALVLWGSEDKLVAPASARVLFRSRKHVRFVEVAGAGHNLHEEEPDVVADLIKEFLR